MGVVAAGVSAVAGAALASGDAGAAAGALAGAGVSVVAVGAGAAASDGVAFGVSALATVVSAGAGLDLARPCSTVLIWPGVLATTSGSAFLSGSMAITYDCGARLSAPLTPSVSSTPPVATGLSGISTQSPESSVLASPSDLSSAKTSTVSPGLALPAITSEPSRSARTSPKVASAAESAGAAGAATAAAGTLAVCAAGAGLAAAGGEAAGAGVASAVWAGAGVAGVGDAVAAGATGAGVGAAGAVLEADAGAVAALATGAGVAVGAVADVVVAGAAGAATIAVAAGAGAAAGVALAVACVAAGLPKIPSVARRSRMHAPTPVVLVIQLVTTGPATINTTMTRVATAAPMVTARGRVGTGSASCFSNGAEATTRARKSVEPRLLLSPAPLQSSSACR